MRPNWPARCRPHSTRRHPGSCWPPSSPRGGRSPSRCPRSHLTTCPSRCSRAPGPQPGSPTWPRRTSRRRWCRRRACRGRCSRRRSGRHRRCRCPPIARPPKSVLVARMPVSMMYAVTPAPAFDDGVRVVERQVALVDAVETPRRGRRLRVRRVHEAVLLDGGDRRVGAQVGCLLRRSSARCSPPAPWSRCARRGRRGGCSARDAAAADAPGCVRRVTMYWAGTGFAVASTSPCFGPCCATAGTASATRPAATANRDCQPAHRTPLLLPFDHYVSARRGVRLSAPVSPLRPW